MLPQLFNGVEPYVQLPHSAVLVYTLIYKHYVGKDLYLTVGWLNVGMSFILNTPISTSDASSGI